MWRSPVVTSLTDKERDELSRKNAEANKRSADNARARGGALMASAEHEKTKPPLPVRPPRPHPHVGVC